MEQRIDYKPYILFPETTVLADIGTPLQSKGSLSLSLTLARSLTHSKYVCASVRFGEEAGVLSFLWSECALLHCQLDGQWKVNQGRWVQSKQHVSPRKAVGLRRFVARFVGVNPRFHGWSLLFPLL